MCLFLKNRNGLWKADNIHLIEASFSARVLMIHEAQAPVASMSINLGSLDDHGNSKFPIWVKDHNQITRLIQNEYRIQGKFPWPTRNLSTGSKSLYTCHGLHQSIKLASTKTSSLLY